MNGRGRRNKGLAGERELAAILEKHLKMLYKDRKDPSVMLHPDITQLVRNGVRRNTSQSQIGGSDITSIPYLLIEVKRCEKLAINTWWKQVNKSCRDFNYRNKGRGDYDPIGGVAKKPVLAYRQNNKKWRFVLKMSDWMDKRSDVFIHESNDMIEMPLEAFLVFLTTQLSRKLGVKELEGKEGVVTIEG